jgi:TolB-like protein/class 3 adenylate cyclase/cytochrome c-type biogenesis protein CcmH/NrfG
MQSQHRHLAAILFTDIVGYTAMMQQDEQNAVSITKRYTSVLKQLVPLHGGEILNDYGDGCLCSFSSATEAVRCAIQIQKQLRDEPKVPLRIGLHIGEVLLEDGKIFGDGVNVASRIQSLAQGNSILFSKEIFDKIKNQPDFKSISLGSFEFKSVDEPMEVFALANDGLTVPRKEDLIGKLKEVKKKSGRGKWIIISSALVLAVAAFFIFGNLKNKNGFKGKDRSVVILPFNNYTNSPEEASFIDGITEEITTQLAKIADIKVIGRTSAVLFKNSKKPLDQIAEILGVSAYLEGSVQKEGNTVRITAQLIDANTQEHIWAERYDRDLKDIFSMQSEVAQEIARQLHAKLTDTEKDRMNKKPTDNIEAFKFYSKGRLYADRRTPSGDDSAEANYNKAIELDPNYALAYAGKADLYIVNLKGLSQPEAIPIAKDFANKALLLDSNLSEALTTLGFTQSAFDYDWRRSKNTLKQAIDFNPNYSRAHLFYGNLLQYTGESTEQGINELKKALSLDPLSNNLNYVLGRNYYLARKYDSSYEQLKKTLALFPDFHLAQGNLVFVLLAQKNYTEAFQVIEKLDTIYRALYYKPTVLSYAHAISGNKIGARSELEKSLAKRPDQSPYDLAKVYVALNDYTEALNKLEKAYQVRDVWMYTLNVDPAFDPIRNEPRFKALLKKMNLE